MFEFNIRNDVKITYDLAIGVVAKTPRNTYIDVKNWDVTLRDINIHQSTSTVRVGVAIGSEVYKVITNDAGVLRYPSKKFFTLTKREWVVEESSCYQINDTHVYIEFSNPLVESDGNLLHGFICDSKQIYYPITHNLVMGKDVTKIIVVLSDADPHNKYEVVEYKDGTYSCNCPGWTKRVNKLGKRECKHVKRIINEATK